MAHDKPKTPEQIEAEKMLAEVAANMGIGETAEQQAADPVGNLSEEELIAKIREMTKQRQALTLAIPRFKKALLNKVKDL